LNQPPSLLHPFSTARRIFVPQRVVQAVQAFVGVEASSGIVLLMASVAALVWANSPWSDSYEDLWHTVLRMDLDVLAIELDLRHAVNDGLMTLFFFIVGLEIKRELAHGELSSPSRALLPATAALGGMAVPALLYTAFNLDGDGADGWGVPMATDIAFALGMLSLLGRRIPFSVKVFLLALAIADDIGAVLVIAVFYTSNLDAEAAAVALAIFGLIVAMNRAGVRSVDVYVAVGILLWLAVFESGVHATLAGVALGLLTPARPVYSPDAFAASVEGLISRFRDAQARGASDESQALLGQIEDLSLGTEAPLDRLERKLHPWVSYAVVPLFALANAGISLSSDLLSDAASSPVTAGIALGLLIGKPVGIVTFTALAVRFTVCELPTGSRWAHIVGVGLLGGIGFTVSLLIAALAFEAPALADEAKVGILGASLLAGALGFVYLYVVTKPANGPVEP
jgi:NhaA family Na+:H+ antiporter